MTDAYPPDSVVPQSLTRFIPAASSTLATVIVGFTIATTLYGISVLQTYYYLIKFWMVDSWQMKSFVSCLWILDTLTTALVAHILYYYTVLNYGNPLIGLTIPWSMGAQSAATDLITFVAHMYYAYQIYHASDSRLMPALIVFLSSTALAGDLTVTVIPVMNGQLIAISDPHVQIIGTLAQSLCVLCDTTITLTLIRFFRAWRKETNVSWTVQTLNSLVIYAVSRGAVTAAGQLLFVSMYVAYPQQTYWLPFNLVVAKLYVNSVLSSLNARKRFEEPRVIFMDDLSLSFRSPGNNVDSIFGDIEATNHHISFASAERRSSETGTMVNSDKVRSNLEPSIQTGLEVSTQATSSGSVDQSNRPRASQG